jgi:hypothetical protein
MILRAEICNPLPHSDLDEPREGRCTRVEVNNQLAEFIAAWPSLPERHREAISMMVTATGPAKSRSAVCDVRSDYEFRHEY